MAEKLETILVRFPPKLKGRLFNLAAKNERSLAAEVRRAVAYYLLHEEEVSKFLREMKESVDEH